MPAMFFRSLQSSLRSRSLLASRHGARAMQTSQDAAPRSPVSSTLPMTQSQFAFLCADAAAPGTSISNCAVMYIFQEEDVDVKSLQEVIQDIGVKYWSKLHLHCGDGDFAAFCPCVMQHSCHHVFVALSNMVLSRHSHSCVFSHCLARRPGINSAARDFMRVTYTGLSRDEVPLQVFPDTCGLEVSKQVGSEKLAQNLPFKVSGEEARFLMQFHNQPPPGWTGCSR
ncbi:grsB [Symbiodinium natans]|uniref:GrsB protein n=1 Tax=Symbiodinium natans TaxID=878477 RepID=A0A812UTG0_9DINO|nr:grsB [Symbiodinium natans]